MIAGRLLDNSARGCPFSRTDGAFQCMRPFSPWITRRRLCVVMCLLCWLRAFVSPAPWSERSVTDMRRTTRPPHTRPPHKDGAASTSARILAERGAARKPMGETGVTLNDSWSSSPSGLVVGGTLGYNWQLGPMIYGVEGRSRQSRACRQRRLLRASRVRRVNDDGRGFLYDAARPSRRADERLDAVLHRRLSGRRHDGLRPRSRAMDPLRRPRPSAHRAQASATDGR